jgi:isoquinoline 1-oxidoreductase beta subunit
MGVLSRETGLSRRGFILASLSAAGGLIIGIRPVDAASPDSAGAELGAWIVIDPDESVTLRVAKSEMGQGIFTALPMILAEELACDWRHVRAEYAAASRNLADKQIYGSMGTGGSRSVRGSHEMLQQIGASARERLIAAAAKRWQVAASECGAANGHVQHAASGQRLSYGALAAAAVAITLDQEPAIKAPESFTLAGLPLARLDTKPKTNGQAAFGIDTRLPDMLYAAVTLCPVPGGKVKSYDDSAVLKRRGVHSVVPVPGGLAVVADRFWRAKEAAAALQVQWDPGQGAGTSSAAFRRDYRAALNGPLETARKEGDARATLAATPPAGGKLVEALYEVPHLAHAPMEPLNCTARVTADKVEVWLGTQNPDMALQLAAKAAGMAPEKVEVHNCFLGGGFGRRSMNDELVHAVTVAKAVGRPVKLIWTRETDMQHDRYRPQAALRARALLAAGEPTAEGSGARIEALHLQTAVGSITRSLGWKALGPGIEPQAIEGLANQPYAAANLLVECILKNTHIPIMFWRSVGSSQNAFVVESFIDELAHAAGEDPYKFRRRLLMASHSDYVKVLDVAAEKAGWASPLPAGKGRGIAIHEAFGTIVSQVAEVAIDKGQVRVERVVVAVDCGHVINPRLVQMQMESGVIYGLTAALGDAITIKDGAVEQTNFDSYPMLRMADAPRIETYIALSGGKRWGGIGEPGTPPVAPAVCNAIFAITGKRIRALPISDTDLTGRT